MEKKLQTGTAKRKAQPWKWNPADDGWADMNANALLAEKYLLHLLRSFKANPQFAVMVSGVKIARLAELAGMAVAVRARAYAYAAAEAEKLRFADAQVLARKRKKGKAVRK